MKKVNFSLVAASVMFFLFVGVQVVSAQGSFTQNVLTDKEMSIDGIQLVNVDQAIDILSGAYKTLYTTPTGSSVAEANQAARLAYYEFLLQALGSGQGVGDILPNSNHELLSIVGRYQGTLGIDVVAIYDETVQLLEDL